MSTNALSLENIYVHFTEHKALTDICLSIKEGQIVGIFGPNGAGKTTLLKVILGLISPASGKVRFGEEVYPYGRRRHFIGYLPQIKQFDRRYPVSAFDVAMMGRVSCLGLLHKPKPPDKKAVLESLSRVNMYKFANHRFGDLSGGQQQKVLLARAICGHTRLLLLDEPTNGLDLSSQENFYTLLDQLKKEMTLTVITVSHDLAALYPYVHRLEYLNRTLTSLDAPHDLLKLEENLGKAYFKKLKEADMGV